MEAIAGAGKTTINKELILCPRAYFAASDGARKVVEYRRSERVYSQGDRATSVMYIQKGGIKMSVVNEVGKAAIVAMLGVGDFFGEGCLVGQRVRMGTAITIAPTILFVIEKKEMVRLLHTKRAFSDSFIAYMLSRNIRIEQDLVDQLFNSCEKRLARALLLLTQYSMQDKPETLLSKVSQQTLAEMIGTTRARINFFMIKFRKLGFIRYDGGLHINPSLLNGVLHE